MAKTKTPKIDLSSSEVILVHVDERGRSARNAPARDLTHSDIARLAYVEALAEVANDIGQPIDREDPDGPTFERPDHKSVDQARARAIYSDLVESGYFSPDVPESASQESDEEADAATEPDAPAAEPEV